MLKKIILILIFCQVNPFLSFTKEYLLNLNKDNKKYFYLQNTYINHNDMVSIIPQKQTIQNSPDSSFLFLNFNKGLSFQHNDILFSQDSKTKSPHAVFKSHSSYINLDYSHRFTTGILMDFWIKPFTTEEGQIFATEHLSQVNLNQEFRVFFKNGKIHFFFYKLFDTYANLKKQSVELVSNSVIPYNQWTHHKFIYNPKTGRLSYYFNDKIDAENWASTTSMPNGELYFLHIPENSNFFLGKGFRGALDNFFLSSDINSPLSSSLYSKEGAWIHTRVLKLKDDSFLKNISINGTFPKYTGYKLEYRFNKMPFSDVTPDTVIPWTEFNILHKNKNFSLEGQYIQIRVKLFSNPSLSASPVIKNIAIQYTPLEKPMTPLHINITSQKGNLTISFTNRLNQNITAYKIYLGTQHNSYFGDPDNDIVSPILVPITYLKKVGSKRFFYTIKNLSKYKMYFIKISSITSNGVESTLSKEVSTRIRSLD